MKELPITIRTRPLKAILALPDGRIRLRRPGDGLYKNLAPGDYLWLREQFYLPARFDHRAPSDAEGPGVAPTLAVDLGDRDPADCDLGLSRAGYTLPMFWSRFHFAVLDVERQPLLSITAAEARAEGFATRKAWLREWDDMVSSVSGRLKSRLSQSNPEVLVLTLQLHKAPLITRKAAA
ncbi:MAG: hypothetical protein AAF650_02970 [Pseudomonadota bacterium]